MVFFNAVEKKCEMRNEKYLTVWLSTKYKSNLGAVY